MRKSLIASVVSFFLRFRHKKLQIYKEKYIENKYNKGEKKSKVPKMIKTN